MVKNQSLKMLFPRLLKIRSFCTSKARESPIRSALRSAFGKYLLVTNIASSGVLMGVGDLVQQEIEFQRNLLPERYNYKRLTEMIIIGLAFGPIHHYFYHYLNKVYPKSDIRSVAKKILADQLIMSPICIAVFFYGMSALESKTLAQANEEVKLKFLEVYKVDWLVWPPTQFLNFYYVPAVYQVFYINAITMLYDVFLSYIKYRDAEAVPVETTKPVLENL